MKTVTSLHNKRTPNGHNWERWVTLLYAYFYIKLAPGFSVLLAMAAVPKIFSLQGFHFGFTTVLVLSDVTYIRNHAVSLQHY
jgi:hypothetical protein